MSETFKIRFGREDLILEVGKVAKQADGAVTVQYGGTVVLVTCCVAKASKEEVDFFPLTVEYQEKTYAAGKIPGGFFKREGRPSEKEILTSRLLDRPIRPLFPEGFTHEVQVMGMVLSHDGSHDPDVLAMIGASAALTVSNIPFLGPVGSLRIGRLGDQFVINPTYAEEDESTLDLVLSATRDGVMMVEAGANQVSEQLMLEALEFGASQAQALIALQEEMMRKVGKEKMTFVPREIDPTLGEKVRGLAQSEVERLTQLGQKEEQEEGIKALVDSLVEKLVTEDGGVTEAHVRETLSLIEKEAIRNLVLSKKRRVDGRGYLDIRPISCEIGVLPRTHGSGLFTRGQTQSLAVTTLGTTADEQLIDALEGETFKNFMLHYNFPPFSVGEVRPVRGPGRREIGHGALAERALRPVMPSKEEFPYTVRVVSDILESNGSSSMASVCAGTLSLMDAGVPVKAPVAGIAMGLVRKGNQTAVLTDLCGLEDHFGDMDFKVAGTREGITALQLDVKIVGGLTLDIFRTALEQARQARLIVVDKITQVIAAPKPNLSEFAPRIVTLKINPDKIREVVGPGGKMIRKIIQDTGVTIDIEDDGTVQIASNDSAASAKAVEIIKRLTEEVEVGKIYTGKVKRLMNFGAFCEVLPGKEGLVHISELADRYVEKVEDVVKIGDEVQVKVVEIDQQGRINLSMKQAQSSHKGER
ncbi:MAG: polyribonucleotide nucleotidyltransferase [Candidatus Omnitrophica bacterium]|nr:polyribonucleotide nucleotidyltransferase [Candidatus Omnitrophota bacterium]